METIILDVMNHLQWYDDSLIRNKKNPKQNHARVVKKHDLLKEKWYLHDMINPEWIPSHVFSLVSKFTYILPDHQPEDNKRNLKIVLYGRSEETCRRFMDDYSQRIRRWLGIMFHHKNTDNQKQNNRSTTKSCNVKSVTLHWLLLDVPRQTQIPSSQQKTHDTSQTYITQPHTIIPYDVNGAYTYPCQTDGLIVLFRIENAMKVLIHETVHLFGYDGSLDNNHNNEIIGVKRNNTSFEINLREVRCEVYARLYSVGEVVHEMVTHGKIPSNNEAIRREFMRLLRKNAAWGITRAHLLLRYASGNTKGIIDISPYVVMDNRPHRHVLNWYQEKTPAFSYYVATGILLYALVGYPELMQIGEIHDIVRELFVVKGKPVKLRQPIMLAIWNDIENELLHFETAKHNEVNTQSLSMFLAK